MTGKQEVILRCQTILAHAVSINPERSSDVTVAKHLLNSLHLCSLPNKEVRQAVAQVVEPETYLLAFLEHPSVHRCRSDKILDQHVCGSRLQEWSYGRYNLQAAR
jgi:hypothetical protein